jgi:hypothetical protein
VRLFRKMNYDFLLSGSFIYFDSTRKGKAIRYFEMEGVVKKFLVFTLL